MFYFLANVIGLLNAHLRIILYVEFARIAMYTMVACTRGDSKAIRTWFVSADLSFAGECRGVNKVTLDARYPNGGLVSIYYSM